MILNLFINEKKVQKFCCVDDKKFVSVTSLYRNILLFCNIVVKSKFVSRGKLFLSFPKHVYKYVLFKHRSNLADKI